jgi:hypothetical protein
VYSRPIKVYQGIDNPIQIVVLNQDQKPVDLTGHTLRAEVQDPLSQTTAHSYTITFTDQTKGRGTFTIPNAEVSSLDQRFYWLTLKTVSNVGNIARPVYVDDNWTAPLDLEVLPAYFAPAP